MLQLSKDSLFKKISFSFLILWVLCITLTRAQGHDATQSKISTLYYKVEYIEQGIDSSIANETSTDDLMGTHMGQELVKSESSIRYKYLLPFITNQLRNNTNLIVKPYPEKGLDNKDDHYLIIISINTFDKFLEYHFYLHECNIKSRKSTLIASRSFFINPDNESYESIITNEIQRLFHNRGGKNKPAKPLIKIDGHIVKSSDSIFNRSSLDTIVLDATSSYDSLTPKKYLKYRWNVDIRDNDTDAYREAYLSDFNPESSIQKLVIEEEGIYKFNLKVFDGIIWSENDTVSIEIDIIPKTILQLHRSEFIKVTQKNLWYIFLRKNMYNKQRGIYKLRDSIGFDITYYDDPGVLMDDPGQLIFKYLYSHDKSRKYIIKDTSNSQPSEDGKRRIEEVKKVFTFEPGCKEPVADSNDCSLAAIHVKSCCLKNAGDITFGLTNMVKPGQHNYIMYSKMKDVLSNIDTVKISYREKSILSIFSAIQSYDVSRGSDYHKGYILGSIKVGIRFYLTPNLSIEPYLVKNLMDKNYSDEYYDIGIVGYSGQINYDFYPLGLRRMDLKKNLDYGFTVFAATWGLNLTDKEGLQNYRFYGGGAELRLLLFPNKPSIGQIHLGFDLGIYDDFQSTMWSYSLGFKVYYGLWQH